MFNPARPPSIIIPPFLSLLHVIIHTSFPLSLSSTWSSQDPEPRHSLDSSPHPLAIRMIVPPPPNMCVPCHFSIQSSTKTLSKSPLNILKNQTRHPLKHTHTLCPQINPSSHLTLLLPLPHSIPNLYHVLTPVFTFFCFTSSNLSQLIKSPSHEFDRPRSPTRNRRALTTVLGHRQTNRPITPATRPRA